MEPTIHTAERPQALCRANDGRLIAGVCAGLADHFDVDVVFVRVITVALVLVGGVGLPLYLAAWLLVPDEDSGDSVAERLLGDARAPRGWAPSRAHEAHAQTHGHPHGHPHGHEGGDHDAEAS